MSHPPNSLAVPAVLAMLLVLAGPHAPAVAQGDALERLVKRMVIAHAPRSHEELDGWGRTRNIVTGLKVWRDGWEIKTKRRRKKVNHGTWKRYAARMNDPRRDFHIDISPLPSGAEDTLRFEVAAVARLDVFGRAQEWNRGLRLASISLEADTMVRLRLRIRIQIEADASQFPPDFAVRPRVEQADLKLLKFDARRISHLRGSLAEKLGANLRSTIKSKLNDAEPKLVEKMNAQLKKRQEKFRLSLGDWAKSQWARFTGGGG